MAGRDHHHLAGPVPRLRHCPEQPTFSWRTSTTPDVPNGPTENLSLKIKSTKRIARGHRNFEHYRLRPLLNHDCIHKDHSSTRIRTRAPRVAAWPQKSSRVGSALRTSRSGSVQFRYWRTGFDVNTATSREERAAETEDVTRLRHLDGHRTYLHRQPVPSPTINLREPHRLAPPIPGRPCSTTSPHRSTSGFGGSPRSVHYWWSRSGARLDEPCSTRTPGCGGVVVVVDPPRRHRSAPCARRDEGVSRAPTPASSTPPTACNATSSRRATAPESTVAASSPPPLRVGGRKGRHGGGAGNRTRVLRRFTRASPCAVRAVSTRIHRSCGRAGVTIPVAVRCPCPPRDRADR